MKAQWQPFDTVPRDDTPVLVYLEKALLRSHIHMGRFDEKLGIIGGSFDFDCPKATHWMPLPAPPK
jgi:hypothetical protein